MAARGVAHHACLPVAPGLTASQRARRPLLKPPQLTTAVGSGTRAQLPSRGRGLLCRRPSPHSQHVLGPTGGPKASAREQRLESGCSGLDAECLPVNTHYGASNTLFCKSKG